MPCPIVDLKSWFDLAEHHPREWGLLVNNYFEYCDDVVKARECGAVLPAIYSCDLCDYRASSLRQVSMHRWTKHKAPCNVRMHVADVSCCPICDVEFWSRPRLIKHLLETRVRSKNRSSSCRELLIKSCPPLVDKELLCTLEARDREELRKARKDGHSHIIASKPSRANRDSILKGKTNLVLPAQPCTHMVHKRGPPQPQAMRRRLRCKTRVAESSLEQPPRKRLRVKTSCTVAF